MKSFLLLSRVLWSALVLSPTAACAIDLSTPPLPDNSAEVLEQVRQMHAGTRVDAVAATPIPGLYRVTMGGNAAYVVQDHARYLLFGHLFDTASMTDLTRTAPSKPARIDWSMLRPADAIELVNGDGGRLLAVFTDPACRYCHALDQTLAAVPNLRILLFMVPFQGTALPHAIWCSKDRVAAWRRAMRRDKVHEAGTECDDPAARNATLARSLGIGGTPTMVLADGSRLEGAVSAAEIETALARQSHGE